MSPRPPRDFYRELGRRLRQAREAAGYSQEQVAEWLGVSGPTYGRYESGERRIPIPDVHRVARLLGARAEDLMAEEPSKVRRLPIQGINLSKVPPEDREKVRRAIEALIRQFEEEDAAKQGEEPAEE